MNVETLLAITIRIIILGAVGFYWIVYEIFGANVSEDLKDLEW